MKQLLQAVSKHSRLVWGAGSVIVAGLAAIMLTQTAQAVVVPPNPVLDHFKCYTLQKTEPINDLAFLLDQFGIRDKKYERDLVEESSLFCNPTRKVHGDGGAGISNLDHHLTWYNIRSVVKENFQPRDVVVLNQFAPNGQRLHVDKPSYLAVPTHKILVNDEPTDHKPPESLDHFKCYDVKGEKVHETVKLQDQFDRLPPGTPNTFESAFVVKPEFLCNPTNKAHFTGFDAAGNPQWQTAKIEHPEDHLVCYSLERTNKMAKLLAITNQFGDQKLETIQSKLLCVPSEKRELDTVSPN